MKKAIFTTPMLFAAALLIGFQAQAERYIVKYKDQAAFQAMSQQVKRQHELFDRLGVAPLRQGVQFMNSNAEATDAFQHLGMVVVDTNDNSFNVELLAQHPAIEYIEKEMIIPAPKPLGLGDALPADLPVTEVPWGILAVKAPDAWNLGTKGEGVRVMVLDTGVDKDHPALVANFEKGRDFVGDNGSAEYPFFDSMGHGSHVAGTILADGDSTGLPGVAPRAKLLMGRVCGNFGCPSAGILAGVNWAIEEGVQVVNMSLGGPFPSPGGRDAYAAADAAGVMVVAASGNDGARRISYPAGYETVFSVGAVNPDLTKADFSNWGDALDIVAPGVDILSSVPRGMGRASDVIVDAGGGPERVKSLAMDGSAVVEENVEGELVAAGLGKPEDIAAVDLNGKIALIQRGEIAFGDKARNAINAGAIAVVIYNNADGLALGTLNGEVNVPVVMIEQTVGQALVDQMAEKGESIPAAVGTLPSDYMALAGTSMASPHVAGVAALVRSANPALTPAQVREILRETAIPQDGNDDNQFGRGLIDAAAAVERALSSQSLAEIAN